MEKFSDYSSDVVEFPSTWKKEKNTRFAHTSSLTEPLAKSENKNVQTNEKFSIMVQTNTDCLQLKPTDDRKLAAWLKKIYPLVDAELTKGITPLCDTDSGYSDHDITIKPYQKITDDPSCMQGAAIWLSVRINNAPLLVVTTSPTHNDWCDHVGKSIKVFTPKRMPSQDFVVFSELCTLPVKSCIKFLATNRFNKDIFAGGTFSGDLYIWEYRTQSNSEEVKELHCVPTEHSCIITMDWLSDREILTCHSDGYIFLWKIGKEVIKDKCFKITSKKNEAPAVISAILGISTLDFMVGTTEGQLFVCSTTKSKEVYENCINPIITELESHSFSVASLNKTRFLATDVIMSCDLSGEVLFYDIRNSEDGPTLIVKMPLPFKNCIGCSDSANYIFSPGIGGSLEAFRISNGRHFMVDGNLDGRGSIIKLSDNGSWIVTGIYKGTFQIYKIDN